MVCDRRPLRRLAARSLRAYPSDSIAVSTFFMVASVTPDPPLITRETVFRLTPAATARSFIVVCDRLVGRCVFVASSAITESLSKYAGGNLHAHMMTTLSPVV